MQIYLSTHSSTCVSKKAIEIEKNIYITANNIIISRSRAMFGRQYRLFSAASKVRCRDATPFVECYCSVLWPLAGDVVRSTCSLTGLALDGLVF